MQFVGVRPRRYGDPTTDYGKLHTQCGEVLQAEVGTALVVLDKFIRTSVRKVAGATDR